MDRRDRPEPFRRACDVDEAFWRKQERTLQGASGQPCCTLSGISTGFIRMDGDFAVVVHGEDECAACFLHYGPGAHRFFATGLEERHFVKGETKDRLRRCLELVAEQLAPKAIFVLGTCPIEVIGDRFEVTVAEVQARYPHIAMRPMHTSGLKVGSQAAMLDWMWSTLVALPSDAPSRGPRSLAFLGLPEVEAIGLREHEWVSPLAGLGVDVVGAYPYGRTLDDWRAMATAGVTLVADRALYPKTVKQLEERGQTVREIPLPVGLEQTDRFYAEIGDALGCGDALREAVAPARAAAVAALDDFRRRHGPLRLVMGLRMLNDYRPDQVAYHGFGDYAAIAELGFDITVLVQGPTEKKERFQRLFEARGVNVPFDVFAEPWNLSALIRGRFDVAYLADYCRDEARKAGVPMIVSRHLAPYYAGVVQNVAQLDKSLASVLGGA